MKHLTHLLTLLATALLFVACSSSSDDVSDNPTTPTDNDTAYPIHLQMSLAQPVTRAGNGRQSTIIDSTQTVYAWSDLTKKDTVWFGAWPLKPDGGTGLRASYVQYFPQQNRNVNFYTIHGQQNYKPNDPFPTEYKHVVAKDQKTDSAYYISDLIYGSRTDVPRQASTVYIPMYHMLTKVQVVLKSLSEALPDAEVKNATVDLIAVKRGVKFKPAKVDTTQLADFDVRGNMVELDDSMYAADDETYDTIRISTAMSPRQVSGWATEDKDGDAVIPPQLFRTFLVTMPNTGIFKNMRLVANVDKVLKSGYKYTFHITLSPAVLKTGIINVVEWDEEDQNSEFANRSVYPGSVSVSTWGSDDVRNIVM